MLDYVVKLTKDATRISPGDHARLRAVRLRRPGDPPDHADRLVVQLHQPRRRRAGRRPRRSRSRRRPGERLGELPAVALILHVRRGPRRDLAAEVSFDDPQREVDPGREAARRGDPRRGLDEPKAAADLDVGRTARRACPGSRGASSRAFRRGARPSRAGRRRCRRTSSGRSSRSPSAATRGVRRCRAARRRRSRGAGARSRRRSRARAAGRRIRGSASWSRRR